MVQGKFSDGQKLTRDFLVISSASQYIDRVSKARDRLALSNGFPVVCY